MLLEILLLDGEPGGRMAARDQGRGYVVRPPHGAGLREHHAPVLRLRLVAGGLQQRASACGVARLHDQPPGLPSLHLLGAQLLDQPAAVDDADAGGETVDLGEDVAGHEHGDAVVRGERAEQLSHLDHAGRVQPVGGLVEDHQVGLVEECGREPEPLPVALRERPRLALGVGLEAQALDGARDGVGDAAQARRRAQVLEHREARVGGGCVDEVADTVPRSAAAAAHARAEHLAPARTWA